MATIEITKDNLQQTIADNDIVLLDFWASWCGPCRHFGPIFEAVSEKYPGIVFGKVDTEAERELAAGFEIMSIPTLMAFKDSVIVFSQAGAMPADGLEELVGAVQELDMKEVHAEIAKQQQAEGAEQQTKGAEQP